MAKTGRRPGRPDTRGEIVAAAARCFARAGYDATSTRQVAAALIDPDRVVTAVAAGAADQAGERLLRYFLALLGDVQQPGPLLGVVRSAVTSEQAAHALRIFLAQRVLGGIAEALHIDQGEVRAALAASQMVGIAVSRYAVRLPALAAADDEQVIGWVAPVLQHYLTGDLQPVGLRAGGTRA